MRDELYFYLELPKSEPLNLDLRGFKGKENMSNTFKHFLILSKEYDEYGRCMKAVYI